MLEYNVVKYPKEKEGFTMKKLLALLLVAVMSISIVACGEQDTSADNSTVSDDTSIEDTVATNTEEQEEKIYFEIGKETTVENFTFTVNEIGFSDSICIEKGDTLGLASKTGDAVSASEGYGWLYYSISYKFTGAEELSAQGQFLPSVEYGEHYFTTPNLRFFKYDGAWHGLDYQWGTGTSIGLPLPATDMMYKYDPWVEKDYELHGAVQVATKAVEDTETPLILRLDFSMGGDAYERVECIVEIEPPAELTPDDRLLTFTYEDREFFKEYVADLTPMTEDEILSVLNSNTFSMRNNYGGDNNGIHSITFFEDGSLDATYTYENEQYTMYDKWRVENNTVIVVTPDGKEIILTPYQYDETRYLLIELGQWGDSSMVLTVE